MSVIFDQLRVSEDGRFLFIDLHVCNHEWFENVYVKKIEICTENQVSALNPFQLSETETPVYTKTFEDETAKSVSLVVSREEILPVHDFNRNMFFVYVTLDGTPSASTPCGLDGKTTVGVTFNDVLIYNKAMVLTKELVQQCKIPQHFREFVLLYQALKMSIDTGHYVTAIEYWRLLTDIAGKQHHKMCKCHG